MNNYSRIVYIDPSCLWYLKEHAQGNIGLNSFIAVMRYILFDNKPE